MPLARQARYFLAFIHAPRILEAAVRWLSQRAMYLFHPLSPFECEDTQPNNLNTSKYYILHPCLFAA
jgi:hypothetical protein